MQHLTSINNSRSFHISESQNVVNEYLQRAQMHGLFTHQECNEDFADSLGILSNDETLEQEQDWIHEYHRCKQDWKANVMHEQNHDSSQSDMAQIGHVKSQISSIDAIPAMQTTSFNILENNVSQSEKVKSGGRNIQKILSDYSLNDLQSAVFKTIAQHSLLHKPQQLQMFVGGPGGIGKSWVIDTLRKFFHCQRQELRLCLASYTGVASKNIHGMTLHSLLGLNKLNK